MSMARQWHAGEKAKMRGVADNWHTVILEEPLGPKHWKVRSTVFRVEIHVSEERLTEAD